MRVEKSLLWIRIGFNADPDPVPDPVFLYLNSDPDPESQTKVRSGSWADFKVTKI